MGFFTRPAVIEAVRFVIVFFGSIVMYVFQLNKGFGGALAFLRRVFPGRPDVFYARLDFLIVPIAGSIIGNILFQPTNPLQSLAAGMGWVGAMNSLFAKSLGSGTGQGGGS